MRIAIMTGRHGKLVILRAVAASTRAELPLDGTAR